MKALQLSQSLTVLVLAGFIWGCAAPPATPPAQTVTRPAKEISKKSQDKKRDSKPTKTSVSKQQPASQMSADPAPEGIPEEEPVVGRMVYYYDYYPAAEVYYDTVRHLYFYYDDGSWVMSVALPTTFQEKIVTSVQLRMQTSLPYTLHQEHLVAYPPAPARRGF